jgi:hypothetical protein
MKLAPDVSTGFMKGLVVVTKEKMPVLHPLKK